MIPEQLNTGRYFLKLSFPDDESCDNPGKRPIGSATAGPFYTGDDDELHNWINSGGNVGRALIDDLVMFDVDHDDLAAILAETLPATFVVETGSGGEHWYYWCESWGDRRQFNTDDGTDWGSLRSDGWQAVIPPSKHPRTGDRYVVAADNPVATVTHDNLVEAVEVIDGECSTQPTQAAAPGRVGSSENRTTPARYPDRAVSVTTARQFVNGNDLDHRFDRVFPNDNGDESGDDWVLCKCMAEAGYAADVIEATMDEYRHDAAKWHRRGDDYRRQTVLKAIQAACDDEYVDFDTADMDATEASERRKTESGDAAPDNQEVTTFMSNNNDDVDFTDKEEVYVQEPTDDGDRFQKVTRVVRSENGDETEYIALKKGRVQEMKLVDGGTALAEQVNSSDSLGSPEYIDELVDALDELQDKLDG